MNNVTSVLDVEGQSSMIQDPVPMGYSVRCPKVVWDEGGHPIPVKSIYKSYINGLCSLGKSFGLCQDCAVSSHMPGNASRSEKREVWGPLLNCFPQNPTSHKWLRIELSFNILSKVLLHVQKQEGIINEKRMPKLPTCSQIRKWILNALCHAILLWSP